MEILVPNAAVRNLIREDKVHQIYSAMQVGQGRYGMQTFNQSLASLVAARQITRELALSMSSNSDELEEMIGRGAVGLQPGGKSAGRAAVNRRR
jgi:twitching motility protein PilT